MEHCDPVLVTQKVITSIYNGVTTVELDNLAAETAAQMSVIHPDYAILAARIAVSNLHKETKKRFSEVVTDLYNCTNPGGFSNWSDPWIWLDENINLKTIVSKRKMDAIDWWIHLQDHHG